MLKFLSIAIASLFALAPRAYAGKAYEVDVERDKRAKWVLFDQICFYEGKEQLACGRLSRIRPDQLVVELSAQTENFIPDAEITITSKKATAIGEKGECFDEEGKYKAVFRVKRATRSMAELVLTSQKAGKVAEAEPDELEAEAAAAPPPPPVSQPKSPPKFVFDKKTGKRVLASTPANTSTTTAAPGTPPVFKPGLHFRLGGIGGYQGSNANALGPSVSWNPSWPVGKIWVGGLHLGALAFNETAASFFPIAEAGATFGPKLGRLNLELLVGVQHWTKIGGTHPIAGLLLAPQFNKPFLRVFREFVLGYNAFLSTPITHEMRLGFGMRF